MRILYECDLAGSSFHGMAYRIFQFSTEFKKRGHEVLIVAASYSHVRRVNPDVKNALTDEYVEGIKYKWIRTPKYNGSGIGRVLHMIVYNTRLWYYAGRIAREFRPEVVISSGVTPLDFIGCHRIAKKAGARKFLEVGDLWPLTPVELGNFSPKHPFIRFMQYAEDFAYSNTDGVISLLPCAESYMIKHGLKSGRFHYIPNGIVMEDWIETAELPNEHFVKINELRGQNKFLIGFTGTHSISNALDTLLLVAKQLENTRAEFILVGDGPVKNELIRTANEMGIRNISFLPQIRKNAIPAFLTEMDALYIGFQKSSLYRFGVSPNKIFDYMMSGKPIIQAIEAGNNLVKEAGCGVYSEPGNVEEISFAIKEIISFSPDKLSQLGSNGKKFVTENHSYDILTNKFLKVLEN